VGSIVGPSGNQGDALLGVFHGKAGLHAFTQHLAMELADHSIRVNAVAPAWWRHLSTKPSLPRTRCMRRFKVLTPSTNWAYRHSPGRSIRDRFSAVRAGKLGDRCRLGCGRRRHGRKKPVSSCLSDSSAKPLAPWPDRGYHSHASYRARATE